MSKKLSLKESGEGGGVRIKKRFPEIITYKVFETNSGFGVE